MENILKDKVCVITGAGKGIGRSIVEVFLKQGARVSLISRTSEDIDSIHEEFLGYKDNILSYAGDVTDENLLNLVVEQTVKEYGSIDVLINNAGMRFRKEFLDITKEELLQVLSVNFMSTFSLSQKVIPIMEKSGGGRIVNISSIAGTLGLPELSAYVSSKAAIIGMTKSIALEFAEKNILVNAIAPGFCKSSYFESFKQKNDLYNFTIDRTPMKRWGECEEIANACLFLASELNSYMTGEVINIDGGWSAW